MCYNVFNIDKFNIRRIRRANFVFFFFLFSVAILGVGNWGSVSVSIHMVGPVDQPKLTLPYVPLRFSTKRMHAWHQLEGFILCFSFSSSGPFSTSLPRGGLVFFLRVCLSVCFTGIRYDLPRYLPTLGSPLSFNRAE